MAPCQAPNARGRPPIIPRSPAAGPGAGGHRPGCFLLPALVLLALSVLVAGAHGAADQLFTETGLDHE